jgi:hypothetical protein
MEHKVTFSSLEMIGEIKSSNLASMEEFEEVKRLEK